ncbi:MAG: NADP-dependent methylenetetrahydromethanopterin/methylenetetrahydrofolate dehydrogenase [Chloroflexi bacterium]|nr:NADP-dependent methylenetetrahydromethanopterin/methylenetetrahydrofolate dehydrogenase [Chloroflexota bacterium]
MKKVLLQLDSDDFPSAFDCITAYDAGVDSVLSYAGVVLGNVPNIVYGAMFTRAVGELKNTAIFIGGSNVLVGEAILKEVLKTFFGLIRVSVMADPNGSNTTASAVVRKITGAINVSGRKVVVFAGTGPVGIRACTLLAKEGADVHLTSRTMQRAKAACELIKSRFNIEVKPWQVSDEGATEEATRGAQILITTGTPGVTLVKKEVWKANPSIKVMADVNAVPPSGIEDIKATDDGNMRGEKIVFGATAIGGLKMKIHHSGVAKLFESNDLVLDIEEIYEIARGKS